MMVWTGTGVLQVVDNRGNRVNVQPGQEIPEGSLSKAKVDAFVEKGLIEKTGKTVTKTASRKSTPKGKDDII